MTELSFFIHNNKQESDHSISYGLVLNLQTCFEVHAKNAGSEGEELSELSLWLVNWGFEYKASEMF